MTVLRMDEAARANFKFRKDLEQILDVVRLSQVAAAFRDATLDAKRNGYPAPDPKTWRYTGPRSRRY